MMLMGTKSRGTSILVTQKWNGIVVVVVVGCLPRLAWMVTWESNCMMMMEKKTRRAAAQAGLDGHLGEPGNQTMPTLVLD